MVATQPPIDNATAIELVSTLSQAFKTPAEDRPAHARGQFIHGTFKPTEEAKELSIAPHFSASSTPIVVRFSSSTGIPGISDTAKDANPRGIAVRFVLSDDGHTHTDIIAHSTPFFPMSTGEGFLEMLKAIGHGTIGDFLGANPSAARFVQAPKPFPVSFASVPYYGVNAFKLIDRNSKGVFVRYQIQPDLGTETLTDEEAAKKSDSYLYDDLAERLAKGTLTLSLLAQVAEEGDEVTDATVIWPESRRVVKLGIMELQKLEQTPSKELKKIIFDPVPRVAGVEASSDPLIGMRADVYLASGRKRRGACPV